MVGILLREPIPLSTRQLAMPVTTPKILERSFNKAELGIAHLALYKYTVTGP